MPNSDRYNIFQISIFSKIVDISAYRYVLSIQRTPLSTKGKEEEDEVDEGDVEEGAATRGDVRQGYVADVGRLEVLQKVCFICVAPNDESAGHRWKEEVVGGHGC